MHASLPYIIITNNDREVYGDDYDKNANHSFINNNLGKLSDVFQKRSFSPLSQEIYHLLGIGDQGFFFNDDDEIFVNWKICSKTSNDLARLPLFAASEQNVKWSDGLCDILKGYSLAIEDVDVITGLEAFMLAAIGKESDMGTVFKLLQEYPVAINPYVLMLQENVSERKKRKVSLL